MNDKGECVVGKAVDPDCDVTDGASPQRVPTGWDSDDESDKISAHIKKWECSKQCKPLNQFEVDAFKAAFTYPWRKSCRQALAECRHGLPLWSLH